MTKIRLVFCDILLKVQCILGALDIRGAQIPGTSSSRGINIIWWCPTFSV
jgi:hypothetical protein